MTTKFLRQLLIVSIAVLAVYGCSKKKGKNEVIIHELSDTDMLNPTNYQSADAGYYLNQLFMTLTAIDPRNLQEVPLLAKAMPDETYDSVKNILTYTYEIRDEAKWDNGTPVTANDVAFSMKVLKCPTVNDESQKPYFELVSDVVTYPADPKKLTIVCNKKYILAKSVCGSFIIMPQYIYDPKKILDGYTVQQFNEKGKELAEDQKLKDFGAEYNSEKYQREKGYIVGCGPYEFDEWVTGQKIVLKKKKDWWGDKFSEKEYAFEAYPDKLTYQVIKDMTGALTALKGLNLDVMYGIKPKDFVEQCKASQKITDNFNLSTPLTMGYYFLGMNMRNPKFEDVRVRQALAHLLDVDKIIHVIAYDLGQRVNGPINPYKKGAFNDTITPYDYNIEGAKKILADAGWKDSNGNGTIDKVINGQLTEFNIIYTYNAGNDVRRDIGMIFKEAARQVGISVDVVPQEWSMYLQNQKQHNFEMFFGGWIGNPNPDDLKQIWGTESINGGSNYVYFGNEQTDKLIEAIRGELNVDKRNDMYRQFQVIVHDQVPYIFLYSPKERIAISKRFTNAETSIIRPGFNESSFKLAE